MGADKACWCCKRALAAGARCIERKTIDQHFKPNTREKRKKNILHAAATIENTSIHHKESNVLSYIFLPLIFDRLLVRI
jgi:hypothetical protein